MSARTALQRSAATGEAPDSRLIDTPAPGALVIERIVGASPAYAAMLAQIRRVAASDAPALIQGETGTGKEVAARCIHYGGARRPGPFVPVNCGALPDSLVESELFGHERGAFTDARQSRRGLVAEALNGTLFLDEVDALSPKAQVTLLRFLQDQRYRPVGTAREHSTDVRLIAAANRPLEALVDHGEFRADLLYRLKILYLLLPPLRERGDDVLLLVQHFVRAFACKYHLPERPLHAHAVAWLREHRWPGNVRELENWVHREFLMCDSPEIGADLPASGGDATAAPVLGAFACFRTAKAEAVRRFECEYLQHALREAQGNVSQAARLSGKERRAFGKLLKKHGIERGAVDC